MNTEMRPGYTTTGSGMEVYDIQAHIQRAFEGQPVGKTMRPREIQMRGRRDNIPSSKAVILDVIKARLRAALHYTPIEGIVVDYDFKGKLVAYRKGELPTSSGAINNPAVECCGRDAANCDCHPLAVMMAEARKALGDRAEEVTDRARDLAIALIASPGYTCDDVDINGDTLDGNVQTLFMLGFMLKPELMGHHEEALLGGNKEYIDNTDDNLYSTGVKPGEIRDIIARNKD